MLLQDHLRITSFSAAASAKNLYSSSPDKTYHAACRLNKAFAFVNCYGQLLLLLAGCCLLLAAASWLLLLLSACC